MADDNLDQDQQLTDDEQAAARGDNYDPTADASAGNQGEGEGDAAAAGADTQGEGEKDTGDGQGDQAQGDAAQGDDKPIMIPKSRFDAVRNRFKADNEALRAEIEQLKSGQGQQAPAQQQQEPQYTPDQIIGALDQKYAKALADGEHEQAAKYMSQIRGLERQLYQNALSEAVNSSTTESQQGMAYDLLLDQVEAARPELDENSESFDPDMSEEMVSLVEAFTASGQDPKTALERALSYVYPNGWNTNGGAQQTNTEQRSTNVQKNIDAHNAQAPRMDRGENSDARGRQKAVPDIMKMSDKEFDALTEKELSALRGDDFG